MWFLWFCDFLWFLAKWYVKLKWHILQTIGQFWEMTTGFTVVSAFNFSEVWYNLILKTWLLSLRSYFYKVQLNKVLDIQTAYSSFPVAALPFCKYIFRLRFWKLPRSFRDVSLQFPSYSSLLGSLQDLYSYQHGIVSYEIYFHCCFSATCELREDDFKTFDKVKHSCSFNKSCNLIVAQDCTAHPKFIVFTKTADPSSFSREVYINMSSS